MKIYSVLFDELGTGPGVDWGRTIAFRQAAIGVLRPSCVPQLLHNQVAGLRQQSLEKRAHLARVGQSRRR